MKGFVDSQLVNDCFGDAGLYLNFRFARRALLFDLGDVQRLTPRQLRRVSHVFVSHAHMDHFYGFDRLLLICAVRPSRLDLFGPPGFIDRVEHKLAAYTWNLIGENDTDFVIGAAEFEGDCLAAAAEFHTADAFARRTVAIPSPPKGIVLDESEFRIRAATLDHRTPSLAFALEQKLRINVWKDRVHALGLPVGPWLNDLKSLVRKGAPDREPFTVAWQAAGERHERRTSLGELKSEILRFAPGEKIAYVVDAIYHERNAEKIIDLARGADRLFIEAVFLEQDAALAARKFHLTAAQAGSLARNAQVKRVVPFHFSTRYRGREDEIRREVELAFGAGGLRS